MALGASHDPHRSIGELDGSCHMGQLLSLPLPLTLPIPLSLTKPATSNPTPALNPTLPLSLQGLAPNSGQRVLTPSSGHFLFLLLHFWSDSAHTGLNRTGIITHKFKNQERYRFRSLNIRKREKVHLKYPLPVCFLFFETNNFIISKLKLALCGILLFLQILIVRFISVWVESVEKWNIYVNVRNWESKHAVRNWVPILVLLPTTPTSSNPTPALNRTHGTRSSKSTVQHFPFVASETRANTFNTPTNPFPYPFPNRATLTLVPILFLTPYPYPYTLWPTPILPYPTVILTPIPSHYPSHYPCHP